MNFADLDRFQREWDERSRQAQARAAHAYERLLQLAERSDSGQAQRVACFIASTCDGQTRPFDLYELRTVDVEIGDDMLACLDALRWGKANLQSLVPDGPARIARVLAAWGLDR